MIGSKLKKFIKMVFMTIMCVFASKSFAEAIHWITITNNSSFPVTITGLSSTSGFGMKCLKDNLNNYNNAVIQPNTFLQILFSDSNTGECYYADKSFSFNLVSKVFSSNPIYDNVSTENVTFQHSSKNQDWSTRIWTAPRNSTNIQSLCSDQNDASSWNNPRNCQDEGGTPYRTENTKVNIYISNPSQFSFNSNMQIFNLSNTPINLINNSNNCQLSSSLESYIRMGGQSTQYSMSFTSTNNSNLGKCGFTGVTNSGSQLVESFNFGLYSTYPQSTMSWINPNSVSANANFSGFVQCMVESQGKLQTLTVDNPNKCFIGCSAGGNVQYKYYRNQRVALNKPLEKIGLLHDYSTINATSERSLGLLCTDADSINTKIVSPKFAPEPWRGILSTSYLLSKNKKYYLFCKTSKSTKNQLSLVIKTVDTNLPIKIKDYDVDGLSSEGVVVMSQGIEGTLYYYSYDGKSQGFVSKLTPALIKIRKPPVKIELTDDGSYVYSDSVGNIFDKF